MRLFRMVRVILPVLIHLTLVLRSCTCKLLALLHLSREIHPSPPRVAVLVTGFRGDAHELVMEPLPNAPGKINFNANNPRYENMSVFHSYTVNEVLKAKLLQQAKGMNRTLCSAL